MADRLAGPSWKDTGTRSSAPLGRQLLEPGEPFGHPVLVEVPAAHQPARAVVEHPLEDARALAAEEDGRVGPLHAAWATARWGRSRRSGRGTPPRRAVQMAFMASTRSHMIETRYRGSTRWLAISSRFQPAPTPTMTRPTENWSRLEICLASTIGSWSGTTRVLMPRRIRRVTEAMAARLIKRVVEMAELLGQLAARGVGRLRRLTGMWECSPSQTDSKP